MATPGASVKLKRLRQRFGINAPKLAIKTLAVWYWCALAVIVILSALAAWISNHAKLMELCAKACHQGLDLANPSGRSPGSEIAPMVLGVFPKNLDEIEFLAVGRQIEQEEFVVGLPALGDGGFDILMDRGIVQSQEGEFVGVRGFRQMVKEWNDVFSPDVVFVKLEMKFSLGVVQAPMALTRLRPRLAFAVWGWPNGAPLRWSGSAEFSQVIAIRPATRLIKRKDAQAFYLTR